MAMVSLCYQPVLGLLAAAIFKMCSRSPQVELVPHYLYRIFAGNLRLGFARVQYSGPRKKPQPFAYQVISTLYCAT
jgi:hypothetical protein